LSLENPATGRYFGFINAIDDGGTASYHGMVLSVQRRAARGVTINSNYTWSHCISDRYQSLNSGVGNAGSNNPDNRRYDRGNCSSSASDRRQVFNFTAVAETPQFANTTLRAVGSGWRLSPILRIQSGTYFTVTTTTDVGLSGIATQRVNQLTDDPRGPKDSNLYLNPAAFALPVTGTLGNVGEGSIRGPGYWTFDAALSRTFAFSEDKRLEFRAEAFNLTNSYRRNNPVNSFNNPLFGQVTSAQDPRIMQFALKYLF
jgi:hypothetical protein